MEKNSLKSFIVLENVIFKEDLLVYPCSNAGTQGNRIDCEEVTFETGEEV